MRTYHRNSDNVEKIYRAIGAIHAGLMTLTEIIGEKEQYLEELISTRASTRGEELTKTERQISVLIAEGKSVPEIAYDRDVTLKTVQNQLTEAMAKLGFSGYREFLGWTNGAALMKNSNEHSNSQESWESTS